MDEVAARLAGDHRRARAPVGRALQRHEVVGERVVRARPELARGHRLAVLLHHRHRRPAGEEHGRRAARLLAGRPPPHRGLRRRPVRGHEPAPVVPGRGREAPLPDALHVPPAVRATWAGRHRDRPAAHRDRPPRRHPPGGDAGRGSDAAGGHGAADPRRGPLRPRLRRREHATAARAPARRGRALHPRVRGPAHGSRGRRRGRGRPSLRPGTAGRGGGRHRSQHGAPPARHRDARLRAQHPVRALRARR